MIGHSKPYVTPFLSEKICTLLQEGDFVSAPICERVKNTFQKNFALNNLYFTQSGSHSLYWILKGLKLSQSDEVIIPSYACPSILHALLCAGVTPVLCDIGDRWHMTRENVEQKITKKTKAIVVVSLFGMFVNCFDFRFPGVLIINDLCQCPNIFQEMNMDYGDFIFFSFHPTKYLNAGGYGAFSVQNDKYYSNYIFGDQLKFQMSNLNLIILEEQLKSFEEIVKKRKYIANTYFLNLSSKYTDFIEKENNAFFRFPLTHTKSSFNQIQSAFSERKIAIRRGVDQLIHRILNKPDHLYPNATRAYNWTVSIPIYPALMDKHLNLILNATSELLDD
jgi:perosamine synthetase